MVCCLHENQYTRTTLSRLNPGKYGVYALLTTLWLTMVHYTFIVKFEFALLCVNIIRKAISGEEKKTANICGIALPKISLLLFFVTVVLLCICDILFETKYFDE